MHVLDLSGRTLSSLCMIHTSWGDLAVLDAHVHFFSRRFYENLAQQTGASTPELLESSLHWSVPEAAPTALAGRWVAELDRKGVTGSVLIASIPGDESSVAAAVAAYPDRFFGYFMLDPLQPGSVDRISAAASTGHLHGICLFPAMHKYSVSDPRLLPVFEAVAASNFVVFVHCGALSVGVRKKLGLPSHFDMRFSNPLDLHPVAARFPGIRFVIPHFGAGLFRETLMLADLCPNVWLDTSSSNRWMAYEGLDLRAVFRRTIDVLGLSKLLFGSDSSFFPRGWNASIFEEQATALYELGLTKDQAEQIFGGNLAQLHGATS